jgi:NAD(P)-dependent dehydrogenase (short-subunit alcohol dehydrogenase family)
MQNEKHPVALITGGSRGIGADTAVALAERGFDVAITYRNKAARAEAVVASVKQLGRDAIALGGDLTDSIELDRIIAEFRTWRDRLDLLILNASGGMEKDLVAANPDYPMLINRDTQLAILDRALPLMPSGGTIVFLTSHWAHRYGTVRQLPEYEPVARTKHAGELAIRARLPELSDRGLRLIVVTGDMVEGTITVKLLNRVGEDFVAGRREQVGEYPTTHTMAEAIVAAALDPSLLSGETVVVGGSLDSLDPL